MKFFQASILLLVFIISANTYAIAPVVDAYDEGNDASVATSFGGDQSSNIDDTSDSTTKSSFSPEQRLSIQEQQIANLNPLLVQMDDLRQKVQMLQGKLEEQQHHLKVLEEQVRNQYQDIDKRLSARTTPIFDSDEPSINAKSSSTAKVTPINHSGPSMLDKTTAKPVPGVPTALGERAYQAAFQQLKNKQYQLAIQRFEDFIKKYPYDINLPNANYFLGQLYLLQGEPEQSISRFDYFTKTYPRDARIPDALLQLGLAYFAKGEKSTAMDTFKKIIRHYPDSKSAQVAQARLQQFQAMVSAANADIVPKNKG